MRRTKVSVSWVGGLACLGLAAACNLINGVASLPFEGSDGGAGSPSSSGSTGSSSSTGGPACTDAGHCPAVPAGPCAKLGQAVCDNGVCGVTYTAGDAASQQYGNCHRNTCDTSGKVSLIEDNTNVFDSGNSCRPYLCVGGSLKAHSLAQDAACPLQGTSSGYCEPDGHSGLLVCAACNPSDPSACVGTTGTKCAVDGMCRATHCSDGMKDADETGTDCGGGDCSPCAIGVACSTYKDCASLVCTGSACGAPSCTDGRQNGTETDVDCGGASCPRCGNLLGCSAPTDCMSGVCKAPKVGMPDICQAPSCTDGVLNGGETGVDCGGDGDGGVMCPPCSM